MQSSDLPVRFTIPFANGAGGSYIQNPIPQASQIGIANGRASFTDGFVPLNFLPVGAGGVPPFGQDMNGILYMMSAWNRWQAAGGAVPYNGTYQTAIGGYPKGAIVESAVTAGLFWLSTAENNVTDPDSAGAGWQRWPVGTNKSLFNVQQLQTSTRVVMTGNAGNSRTVTVWTPSAYVKQSDTSDLAVWLTAPTFTITNGPTSAILALGASSLAFVASNNTASDSRGSSVLNNKVPVLQAGGAGSKSISLTYKRSDTTDWQAAFCPTSADNGYLPAATTATIIIGEIEP